MWFGEADLAGDEVHIWTIARETRLGVCREILDDEERERTDRLRFERDRITAVLSLGFRRLLLGRYVDADPRALSFELGPHGKPFLTDSALHFNISHAGDFIVFAVSRGRAVGIDIERAESRVDLADLAAQSFSPRELRVWAGLPSHRRTAGFYRVWTQKEAFIKLLGLGLAFPLGAFDVEVDADRPPALLACRSNPPSTCHFSALQAPPGYASILAVEGVPPALTTFSLD